MPEPLRVIHYTYDTTTRTRRQTCLLALWYSSFLASEWPACLPPRPPVTKQIPCKQRTEELPKKKNKHMFDLTSLRCNFPPTKCTSGPCQHLQGTRAIISSSQMWHCHRTPTNLQQIVSQQVTLKTWKRHSVPLFLALPTKARILCDDSL